MALRDDIAGDYTHFDGVETVTVTTQPDNVETAGVPALQRPLQLGPDGGGELSTEVRRAIWNVWSKTLVIRPGDSITEADDTRWIVESGQHLTLRTRWRLICHEAR